MGLSLEWLEVLKSKGLIPTTPPEEEDSPVYVDVPPSVNNLFCTGKNGKRFPSKEYKLWVAENGWKLARLGAVKRYPVAIVFTVEFELRKGRDLDNLNKAILDTMKKVKVIEDDDWQHVNSVTVKHNPAGGLKGVRIEITEATE